MKTFRPTSRTIVSLPQTSSKPTILFSKSNTPASSNATLRETTAIVTSPSELAFRARFTENSTPFQHALNLGDLEVVAKDLPQGVSAQTTIELDLETNKRRTTIELSTEITQGLFANEPEAIKVLNEEIAHANQSVVDPSNLSLSEYTTHRLFQELTARATSEMKFGNRGDTEDLVHLGRLIQNQDYQAAETYIKEQSLLPQRYQARYSGDYNEFTSGDRTKIVQRNYSLTCTEPTELVDLTTFELAKALNADLADTLLTLLEDEGDSRIVGFLEQMELGLPFHAASDAAGFKSVFEAEAIVGHFLHEHSGLNGEVDLIVLLQGKKNEAIAEPPPGDPAIDTGNGTADKVVVHAAEVIDLSTPQEPGIVRNESELSTASVTRVLNGQVETINAFEIQEIIDALAPKGIRASLILSHATQFGNMESLNSLAKQLVGFSKKQDVVIVAEGGATLADNLYYLSKRGVFPHKLPITIVDSFNNIEASDKRGYAFIVDEVFLHRLENDPKLSSHLQQLQDNGTKLRFIIPVGWDKGVNVFSQCTDLERKVNEVAGMIDQLSELHIGPQDAIIHTLTTPITKRLQVCGMKRENIKLVENTDNNHSAHSAGTIAAQLSSPRISEGKVNEILKHLPREYRGMAREILARDAIIFSPLRLSKMAIEQKSAIDAYAHRKGLEGNIIYYVPTRSKSYGMATMHYIEANKIPQDQVVTDLSQIDTNKGKPLVVVLDNFAGTGESHADVHGTIRDNGYSGHVLIAPNVSTIEARNIFDARKAGDKKLEFLPGILHTEFPKSDYYQTLNMHQRAMYEKILDYMGYGELGLCVVFPYTAPNNNNRWFNNNFAPSYTLNGKGIRDYEEDLKKARRDS